LITGLLGAERLLMTGKLHLPVPALVLAGPLYRGEGFFMLILIVFLVTVMFVGPAWCSWLCYVGAWDNLAASSRRPQKARHYAVFRLGIFPLVLAAAWTFRQLGVGVLAASVWGPAGKRSGIIELPWEEDNSSNLTCSSYKGSFTASQRSGHRSARVWAIQWGTGSDGVLHELERPTHASVVDAVPGTLHLHANTSGFVSIDLLSTGLTILFADGLSHGVLDSILPKTPRDRDCLDAAGEVKSARTENLAPNPSVRLSRSAFRSHPQSELSIPVLQKERSQLVVLTARQNIKREEIPSSLAWIGVRQSKKRRGGRLGPSSPRHHLPIGDKVLHHHVGHLRSTPNRSANSATGIRSCTAARALEP